MKIDDLSFDIVKISSANKKHPAAAMIEVNSESKTILGIAVRKYMRKGVQKSELVVFYKEKEDENDR